MNGRAQTLDVIITAQQASLFPFYNLGSLYLSNKNKNVCTTYFRQLSYALSEAMDENVLEQD